MAGKFKTKKSVVSRIVVTGSGKLRRRKPGVGHFLAKKSSKLKRCRAQPRLVEGSLAKLYIKSCGVV